MGIKLEAKRTKNPDIICLASLKKIYQKTKILTQYQWLVKGGTHPSEPFFTQVNHLFPQRWLSNTHEKPKMTFNENIQMSYYKHWSMILQKASEDKNEGQEKTFDTKSLRHTSADKNNYLTDISTLWFIWKNC